jgi:hypothetical protein
LTLRIFFSQGDASPATTQALADLPPEVKIERVYAVHKPFLDAAAQGRWVLSFSGADLGNTDRLYFDPQLVRQRIDQGHESKLKGVLSPWYNRVGKGRLPQAVLPRVCSFQMSVVAEWSWNTRGRTARQFLEAYGTLAGYDDPALFAQWVDAISALTENLTSRPVLELPVNHRPSSIPGLPGKMTTFESPFRAVGAKIKGRTPFAIYSPADLAAALESCRPVLTMAEKLNKPDPAVETRYLMACLHMHEQLSALSAGVVALDPGQPENRAKLRTAWNAFETSATAAVTAKERQLELWQLSPPDAEQARRELQEEWREVRMAMQAALQETVGNAEE